MHCRVRYSLDFDLKICSGQGWEIWCLCAVTICQKGRILNSILVYCSSLYCEYENHKQLTVKYFGKAFGRSKNQSAEISESQQSIDPMNNFPI